MALFEFLDTGTTTNDYELHQPVAAPAQHVIAQHIFHALRPFPEAHRAVETALLQLLGEPPPPTNPDNNTTGG